MGVVGSYGRSHDDVEWAEGCSKAAGVHSVCCCNKNSHVMLRSVTDQFSKGDIICRGNGRH